MEQALKVLKLDTKARKNELLQIQREYKVPSDLKLANIRFPNGDARELQLVLVKKDTGEKLPPVDYDVPAGYHYHSLEANDSLTVFTFFFEKNTQVSVAEYMVWRQTAKKMYLENGVDFIVIPDGRIIYGSRVGGRELS